MASKTDSYPKNLVDQYLKACSKLKKFERVLFKRLAPNVNDVLAEFASLAVQFEEASIYQYAAMCHLGVAKCELSIGNKLNECQSYLRAARAFLSAQSQLKSLQLRSTSDAFESGALTCYANAIERCPDDSVMKAAIIREMRVLHPLYEGTSSFASPAHRIHDLETAALRSLERGDFFAALQQLDDIVDNICERKKSDLYEELLGRTEILRLLLLVSLNLPPARQSPSHIKLIEYYHQVGDFEDMSKLTPTEGAASLTIQMQYVLGDVVTAWCERREDILKLVLEQFNREYKSLSTAQRFVLRTICEELETRV